MSEPSPLSTDVRGLLDRAAREYHGRGPVAERLAAERARLDEPLRVAIAGQVKAGKSTLLNALVGEPVAPTDAGECTRVVTWYRDGHSPRIAMDSTDGTSTPLPVVRRNGALVIDLLGHPADEVARLVVDWPSQNLRASTLIDTPGIASASTDSGRPTLRLLQPDEEDVSSEADAVVYLMRHAHVSDVDLLEAFRDRGVARTGAVNAVAVLSRADEIGSGRVDAMFSARSIAHRYRADPTMRTVCQDVVAVAGLLAETARTLRQSEHAALVALAQVPKDELETTLLSVDRFRRADGAVGRAVGEGEERERLLTRFGIFGIRLGAMLIRQGTASASQLAAEMVSRSGLDELRDVLNTQFAQRRELLKARSALSALDRILRAEGRTDGPVGREIERIVATAHEFTELRLLSALRSGALPFPRDLLPEAELLLGAAGPQPTARLGLPPGTPHDELRVGTLAALARWQRRSVDPLARRTTTDACRILVRSCEGLLAGLGSCARAPG